MLFRSSFGSGSCGNCYYLYTENDGLLIEVVEECDKNPDDEVSKKILKKLIQKGLQGYMDKIVEFSKIDKMESEVWRYY